MSGKTGGGRPQSGRASAGAFAKNRDCDTSGVVADNLAKLRGGAAELLQFRRNRGYFISTSLLGEPGWDILLLVLTKTLEDRSASAQAISGELGLPFDLALRWIALIEDQGYLVPVTPPTGGVPCAWRLSATGVSVLADLLGEQTTSLLPPA